jgi:tRNA-specific 2-thiouridylase
MKKVFIGLSGGVDSSVSAALLKAQGYDVTGVFIKVWQPDWLTCTWREDRRDAMRICAHLKIPFLTFDFEKEYESEVVNYMIAEYEKGRTPNPDVMCNKYVKFGAFLKKALASGADYVATGHYAQIKKIDEGGKEVFQLLEGKDENKDQSYFLWTLKQDQLSKIIFPVGHLEKSKVRKIAKKLGLATAHKKDSQGLCFIGKIDFQDFLSRYISKKQGDVLDEKNTIIGHHNGAHFFTIGQRHGFFIEKKGADDLPLYVISKDIKKNSITVSSRDPELHLLSDAKELREVTISNVSWAMSRDISNTSLNKKYSARIRYRQPLAHCKINRISDQKYIITFDSSQTAISPGQSLVIYDGEVCLGGGIIN